MKNEDGISVFPTTSKLRNSTELAIEGFFCIRDRRNFLIFAINGILEFRNRWNVCIRDRRNFVIFAIDGIFNASRSTEFLFSRSTNKAIESSDAMSDGRIKRSIIPKTLKLCNREFSRNWNSGIPEKREKQRENPIPTSPQWGTKDLFQGFFSPSQRPEKKEQ